MTWCSLVPLWMPYNCQPSCSYRHSLISAMADSLPLRTQLERYIVGNVWTCTRKMALCLVVHSTAGATKLFDPRAEYVTAWPLVGCIQCDLRDRQQPMLLHCCLQSETWCLKKMCKVFGGPDVVWPPLFYCNNRFCSLHHLDGLNVSHVVSN